MLWSRILCNEGIARSLHPGLTWEPIWASGSVNILHSQLEPSLRPGVGCLRSLAQERHSSLRLHYGGEKRIYKVVEMFSFLSCSRAEIATEHFQIHWNYNHWSRQQSPNLRVLIGSSSLGLLKIFAYKWLLSSVCPSLRHIKPSIFQTKTIFYTFQPTFLHP